MHHPILNSLPSNIKKLEINLEKSDPHTLVFYHLHPGLEAAEKFLGRLQAAHYGAVILNRSLPFGPTGKNYPNVLVVEEHEFFQLQQQLAALFYPTTWDNRHLVGVTGTNGKTSTVHLAAQIARHYAKRVLQIGTVGVQLNGMPIECPFAMTTPAYLDLRKLFFQYQAQFDVVFMEVSSHALAQQRLLDLRLTHGAWASFSQDHLDYHHSMESYVAAKKKIITLARDKNFRLLIPAQNDFFALIADLNPLLVPNLAANLPFAFQVNYNQKNLALAWKLNELLWGKLDQQQFPWEQLTLPPGRFETISWQGTEVIIDYAHTPDALTNIAQAIRTSFPGRRLVIVFGCGGDRDRTKRPLMGKIASELGHQVIITTDNPRSEDPAAIAGEIAIGIQQQNYQIILDRAQAISQQLAQREAGDILLIAGKGHEEYQEIQGKKYPFSDRAVVMDFLDKEGKNTGVNDGCMATDQSS